MVSHTKIIDLDESELVLKPSRYVRLLENGHPLISHIRIVPVNRIEAVVKVSGCRILRRFFSLLSLVTANEPELIVKVPGCGGERGGCLTASMTNDAAIQNFKPTGYGKASGEDISVS